MWRRFLRNHSRSKVTLIQFFALAVVLQIMYAIFLCYEDGTIDLMRSEPFSQYSYPLQINAEEILRNIREGKANSIQPINEIPFQFVKIPQCTNPLLLVIIVRSAPGNIFARDTIRRTWGNVTKYSSLVKLTFHVGLTKNNSVSAILDKESELYKDILQSDFEDHYYKLTEKSIMGLKYVMRHCEGAKFALYIDDDYYASIPNALNYLKSVESKERGLWTGYVSPHTPTDRGHWRKAGSSSLSLADYPYDYLPPFVHGGAYMLSRNLVHDFYTISKYTKYLRLDDVYFGAVGKRLNISPSENKTLFPRPFWDPIPVDDPSLKDVIASHRVGKTDEVLRIWRKYS